MFEEVTPKFLRILKIESWVQDDYYISDSLSGNYGVVILSKCLLKFELEFLKSKMGRNFLFGDCEINNRKFRFGTSHLESLHNNSETRRTQIKEISQYYQGTDCIFTGDFNIQADNTQDAQTLTNVIPLYDVWKSLHPDLPGYTYDSDTNSMIKYPKQARFDRFLFKSVNWTVSQLEIIGTEKVRVGDVFIYPSDHFGLKAILSFNDPILKFDFSSIITRDVYIHFETQ